MNRDRYNAFLRRLLDILDTARPQAPMTNAEYQAAFTAGLMSRETGLTVTFTKEFDSEASRP